MGSKGRSGSFEVKVGQTRVKRSGSLRVRVIEVKTFGGQKLGSFEVTRGHLPERSLVRLIVSQQEFVKLTSEPAEWLWHSFEISRIWKIWLGLVTSYASQNDIKLLIGVNQSRVTLYWQFYVFLKRVELYFRVTSYSAPWDYKKWIRVLQLYLC